MLATHNICRTCAVFKGTSAEGLRIEGEADPEKLDGALDAVLFAGSKGEVRSRLVRPGAAAS